MAVILLSILVPGPSLISIQLLALELFQFLFVRYCPEMLKSEIPSSDFCLLSVDWGKLGVPNLAGMSLIKSHSMLCNMSGLQLSPFLSY